MNWKALVFGSYIVVPLSQCGALWKKESRPGKVSRRLQDFAAKKHVYIIVTDLYFYYETH